MLLRSIAVLLIVLLFVLCTFTQNSSAMLGRVLQHTCVIAERPGINWFLGIGITDYDSNRVWKDLRNARSDVEMIHTILSTEYCFNQTHSILLLDSIATKKRILDTLQFLVRTMGPSDNLVVYYAGHGYYSHTTSLGFWVPVDGVSRTSEFISTLELRSNGVAASPALHIVFFVDACYGSGIFEDRRVKSEMVMPRGDSTNVIEDHSRGGVYPDAVSMQLYFEAIEQSPSREAFVSGRLTPVTDGAGRHTPFALFTADYMHAATGPFTVSSIADNVQPKVYESGGQLPRYGHLRDVGDEGGEFVFWRRK